MFCGKYFNQNILLELFCKTTVKAAVANTFSVQLKAVVFRDGTEYLVSVSW